MFRIYLIENSVNRKMYIGKTSKSVNERWTNHKSSARKTGKPWNETYLYRAMRKHGLDNFTVREIDIASTEERANEFEKYYIKLFDTYLPERGYNLTMGGDGVVPNEETRVKIGSAMRGKTHTPEARAKISAAQVGRVLSPEQISKIVAANTGRTASEETKRKQSEARKGRFGGKNHPMFGKKHSLDSIQKMADANTGRPAWNKGKTWGPETREKLSVVNKKRFQDPEERQRTSNAVKLLWQDPAYRAKQTEERRARWQKQP